MTKEKIICVNIKPKPDVRVRVIDDREPTDLKYSKINYPFELFNTVTVTITTTKRTFDFDIYNGYIWNGADIPRVLWRIVGSKTDNNYLIASLIHDYMLQFKKYILNEVLSNSITIDEYRRLTSLIFREKLKNQGTKTIKANIMSWCVDFYQHYFNKNGWKINENK